jgi:hypothetical protein
MLDRFDIEAERLLASSPLVEICSRGRLPLLLALEVEVVWVEVGGLRSGGDGVDVVGSEEDILV